jgi:hypothetical protein
MNWNVSLKISHSVVKITSHCLPGRSAENHKTPVMTGGVWAKIQTGHPLNICLEHYCFVMVVGFWDVTT